VLSAGRACVYEDASVHRVRPAGQAGGRQLPLWANISDKATVVVFCYEVMTRSRCGDGGWTWRGRQAGQFQCDGLLKLAAPAPPPPR